MKIILILLLLISVASASYAETYRWEDANGMHFTDSPGSVPEKYREKVYEATREQIRNSAPQVRVGAPPQISPAVIQQVQDSINQVNLVQQRLATETIKQQQARSLAASNKSVENAYQSLAKFMAMWIMIGAAAFIIWIITFIDIIGSEFTNPMNKILWVLVVLSLGPLGILLYLLIGRSQKANCLSGSDIAKAELISRLHPDESRVGRFNTR